MEQNTQIRRKRSFFSGAFKFLIAVASVAGTVGLWGVFSKKDAQASFNSVTDVPLPTIATLVPLTGAVAAPATAVDTTFSSLPVVSQQSSSPAYSNSNIQVVQPAPVTTTKSSG